MKSKISRAMVKRTLALIIVAVLGSQLSQAQWVQQNSGTTSNLTDVVMLDSSIAIAVGRDGAILRTTNAGTTWFDQTAHLSFIRPWNGISFCNASHGIIVGDRAVVTTTDGGANWGAGSFPGTQKCLSALCISPANIYVGGDSGWVYHTLDTGKTWTSEKISTWPIRSLFAWPGPSSIGLPVFALTPYSLCEKLEYTSGSWRETILTNFQGLGSEAFRGAVCNSGGAGFIVGVQGDKRAAPTIIRKTMSDTVWTGVSQGILHDGTFYGISAPSTNTLYVCGDGGMLYKSTNGGDTWNSFTGLTSRSLKAISFFDVNHGFAVGDSGTILHTNNGGGVFVDVSKEPGLAPKEFLLDQNYPNPFNPVTVINYQLVVNSFVTMRVYDLLGREAAMLVNEEKPAGSFTVRWDATHFASGVYFYRLQAGVFSDTKKLLLLK